MNALRECGKINLYVWGTGAFTMCLLANTILKEFDINFIDNNKVKVGQVFWNKTIQSPENIVEREIPIVICSMLYAEQIQQQIFNMGIENEVIVV